MKQNPAEMKEEIDFCLEHYNGENKLRKVGTVA